MKYLLKKSQEGVTAYAITPKKLKFHLVNTSRAHFFTLEVNEIVLALAEQTNVFILFKYNTVPINIDFNRVRIVYVLLGTYFFRNYNASKFINVTNYTCRFHFAFHLSSGVQGY